MPKTTVFSMPRSNCPMHAFVAHLHNFTPLRRILASFQVQPQYGVRFECCRHRSLWFFSFLRCDLMSPLLRRRTNSTNPCSCRWWCSMHVSCPTSCRRKKREGEGEEKEKKKVKYGKAKKKKKVIKYEFVVSIYKKLLIWKGKETKRKKTRGKPANLCK